MIDALDASRPKPAEGPAASPRLEPAPSPPIATSSSGRSPQSWPRTRRSSARCRAAAAPAPRLPRLHDLRPLRAPERPTRCARSSLRRRLRLPRLGDASASARCRRTWRRSSTTRCSSPTRPTREIDTLCDEAAQYGFASVCVNPVHVKRCAAAPRGQVPGRLHRRRLPARGHAVGDQGARGAPRHPRRRARDRHGDRDRRAQVGRPQHGRGDIRARRRGRARRRRAPQGDHRDRAPHRRGEGRRLRGGRGRPARTS